MNAEMNKVLRTIEEAVQTHLKEERSRIQKLSDQILESTKNISRGSEKNGTLLSEITDATKDLNEYKPMKIFKDLYPEPDGLEARMAAEKAAIPASASAADSAADSAEVKATAAAEAANSSSAEASGLASTEKNSKRSGRVQRSSLDSINAAANKKPTVGEATNATKAAANKKPTVGEATNAARDWARDRAEADAEVRANANREKLNKLEKEFRQNMNQEGYGNSDESKSLKRQISTLKTVLGETGGGRKQTRGRKRHFFRRK
jgi:hypothetical protein|uniref:Uncharacterized protein n=1 Tax=viral metagenome TaxID=1070528 RepID=A0A6C0AI66_9ZZZZ